MNADDGRTEVVEIDPDGLLDYLDPTEDAFLYTGGPTTPALIETLTPGSSLNTWITIAGTVVQLHLSDRTQPIASCNGVGDWTFV